MSRLEPILQKIEEKKLGLAGIWTRDQKSEQNLYSVNVMPLTARLSNLSYIDDQTLNI